MTVRRGAKCTADRSCTKKCWRRVRARPRKQAAVLMARLHMLIYREEEEEEATKETERTVKQIEY